jgi:ribosomal protein S18 acetylase RimI-like enzyme
MQQSLAEAAFEETNAVLFLEWSGDPPKLEPPSDIEIRTLTRGDLKDVLALDERAFLPLWQLSFPALEAALEHSDVATAAYQGSRVPVGYALSTTSPLGGHLARLAVDPPHQGAGVGSALLAHTLDKLRSGGVQTVSVNTQADNQRGLDLYRKFGFEETGQVYPVFTRALPTIPRQWAGA